MYKGERGYYEKEINCVDVFVMPDGYRSAIRLQLQQVNKFYRL